MSSDSSGFKFYHEESRASLSPLTDPMLKVQYTADKHKFNIVMEQKAWKEIQSKENFQLFLRKFTFF